jgi:hypothetical protein
VGLRYKARTLTTGPLIPSIAGLIVDQERAISATGKCTAWVKGSINVLNALFELIKSPPPKHQNCGKETGLN